MGNSESSASYKKKFVGKTITVGSHKVRVRRLIGEGGFSFIFLAEDVTYYSYYIAQNDVDIYVVRTLAAFVCGIIAFMIERFVTNDKLKHGYRPLSFFSRVCFVLCRPVMFDTC